MNKDQVALYLNEHPEFFADYPELLQKFQSLQIENLPQKPAKTLNITDRILKRAQAEKENMQTRLEWFLEVTQANDSIQQNLFEIEKAMLTSMDMGEMIRQVRKDIIHRFEIPGVSIRLNPEANHFVTDTLSDCLDPIEVDGLEFVDSAKLNEWFPGELKPVLRGELKEGSEIFDGSCPRKIYSEALIPIVRGGRVAGALCLGSDNPGHFKEGLRTDFLERTADMLGLAIDNLMMMNLFQMESVIDPITGLYNDLYLEPGLRRAYDRATSQDKPLACIKMAVDSTPQATDNEDKSQQAGIWVEITRILKENARDGDVLIRSGEGCFWILLPGIHEEALQFIVARIESKIKGSGFMDPKGQPVVFRVGSAVSNSRTESPQHLLRVAREDAAQSRAIKCKESLSA